MFVYYVIINSKNYSNIYCIYVYVYNERFVNVFSIEEWFIQKASRRCFLGENGHPVRLYIYIADELIKAGRASNTVSNVFFK